ncbi:MAG: prolyl oligopeptidase family serine peptidase [Paludisphaera borealis]|uniref:S9 family peptidase n=1 Tax=Paludisphaera borealis TaxID=1387353 RepID=UPI00284289EE|nr:prolyl oligopeptidase family serine peptidase [Paludisphaera borealis]MDR3622490.1 prolyl oligopeptidase family serine peptidase [Paludisphaera borealis]
MRRTLFCLSLAVLQLVSAPASGQTTAVPDSIRAEGAPAIPASLSAALNRYQNIRSASFQGWDDTKPRAVYITTRFADTPQVHHVALPGATRRQLTFSAERVLAAKPRPKHDQFLFMADEGGAENYQLFLQDRTGGEPRRLTDGKSRNTSPSWSPSGELLAWSSNARNGRDMDLHLAAPADSHFHRILKEVAGQWSVADWSPDGRSLIAEEYLSIAESYLHVIDVSTGQVRPITPRRTDLKEPPVAAGDARWSKDGRSIYYTSDKASEFRRLARYDLATAAETWLTADVPWDVEGYDLSDDGTLIVVVVNEDGLSNLRVYFAATGQQRSVHKLRAGQLSGVEFRADSHEIGFTLSSAQASSDVFSMDLDKSDPLMNVSPLERWTESETGGLDVSAFVEPELIRYPTFDGKKIPAFVYRPAGRSDAPRPVLIQIHGGPEAQYRPGFLGRLNYLVNELGIVVIMPNVRGSAGYGKSYLKLDDGVLREDAVKDIGSLLDWIAAQPYLDKNRVAVSGGSYGGFMSLAVQTTYNDRIKAGIDVVGISNFVTFLKNTQDYRRDLRRAEYGDERDPKIREFLERISPLARVAKIRTPILVVQGRNDPRVPLSESEQVVAAVKKNEVPVWYVVGQNEGHGFAKKVNQDYLQAVEVLFLRKFLLGEGD